MNRLSARVSGLNRVIRQDRSLKKEIDSQRIAKELAKDVKKILTGTTEADSKENGPK